MVENEAKTNEDTTEKQNEPIVATDAAEVTSTTSVQPQKDDCSAHTELSSTMPEQKEVIATPHDETVEDKKLMGACRR